MKTVILIALVAFTITGHTQSLKEALYSGKLKTDSGTVIRKGDDLASKMDTVKKKPVDSIKITMVRDSTMMSQDSSTAALMVQDSSAGAVIPSTNPTSTDPATTTAIPATRDNNKMWKDYIDSFTTTLKSEVLPNKKIKEGVYSVLIEYEIGVDGQITVDNVSCSPESSALQQQIKERLILSAPQLTPLMGTNGKPRVAKKKQMLTLTK